MLRITQLKLPAEHTPEQLRKKLLRAAYIKENELKTYSIRKRSLDARKKPELYYVYTIDFSTLNEERTLRFPKERCRRSRKSLIVHQRMEQSGSREGP